MLLLVREIVHCARKMTKIRKHDLALARSVSRAPKPTDPCRMPVSSLETTLNVQFSHRSRTDLLRPRSMAHQARSRDPEVEVEAACVRSGIMVTPVALVVAVLVEGEEEEEVVVVLPICPEVIGIVVNGCRKVHAEAVVDGHHTKKGEEKFSSKASLSKGR